MSDTQLDHRIAETKNTGCTEAVASRGVVSGEVQAEGAAAKPCPPSGSCCAGARAPSNNEPDRSSRCADEKRFAPPEGFEEIVAEVTKEEQRMAQMERELGLEPATPEMMEWSIKHRSWVRWSRRQPSERLVAIVLAIANFYYPHSENNALLVEAAQRLKGTKRRDAAPSGQRAGRRNETR